MKTIKVGLNQMVLAAFLIVLMSGNVNAKGTEAIVVSGLENIEEPKLEIENWMLNETGWQIAKSTFVMENEQDESLLLESWMTDKNKWEFPVFKNSSKEKELTIENWMLDETYWKKREVE